MADQDDLRIVRGDALATMKGMADGSIDAVVTDPPYSLGFMGNAWDSHRSAREFQDWCESWGKEALRILKPGGHLLAFGGTRTYHRLACGLEDAGFDVRDTLAWVYGSGFPKSMNVGKAIDAAAGVEQPVVGTKLGQPGYHLSEPGKTNGVLGAGRGLHADEEARLRATQVTEPVTDEAKRWDGWGTALKPAYEPIVLARKPLGGRTIAANVLEHGTGALNIDASRIAGEGDGASPAAARRESARRSGKTPADQNAERLANGIPFAYGGSAEVYMAEREAEQLGRWPANLLLDLQAAAMLDAQTEDLGPSTGTRPYVTGYGMNMPADGQDVGFGDAGGASRFFYVAKASRAEREAGLAGFEPTFAPTMNNGIGGKEHDPDTATLKTNLHPTVKPVDIMRHLVKLVTPPGGLVLDPFTGSGTTGVACHLEGFRFVGLERDESYAELAEARIAWWQRQPAHVPTAKAMVAGRHADARSDAGHLTLDLFGLGS